MEMMYYKVSRYSYQDSLKVLEADIQHANDLAAAIPRAKGGARLQMKLVYTDGKPAISTLGRKASIKDFYTVILPSLKRLHDNLEELNSAEENHSNQQTPARNIEVEDIKQSNADLEREDECGICLEPCTKMVLPNCCHAMCIKCYRNWNIKSLSCPFCRGSIKRVNSEDLWVLTCTDDVVDTKTISREDLSRFYCYVSSLPKDYPDSLFLVYYEYLI